MSKKKKKKTRTRTKKTRGGYICDLGLIIQIRRERRGVIGAHQPSQPSTQGEKDILCFSQLLGPTILRHVSKYKPEKSPALTIKSVGRGTKSDH
jgi:hypothetical protein